MKLSLLFLITLIIMPTGKGDWPQFLGPNRDGLSPSTLPILDSLPDDGLTKRWSYRIGSGFAGPVVEGDRCLIFHRQQDQAILDCLNARTGKLEWTFDYPTGYVDTFGFDNGPRSTPTVSGDMVYIHGAEGMLHALNLTDGKVRWKHDLAAEFESPQGFFGRSSSPLVEEDLVMLDIGGKDANLVAFEAKTGKLHWAQGNDEPDYASPNVLASGKRKLALFFMRAGITGIDIATGTAIFNEPFRSDMHASVNAANPVVVGNQFFLSSCYDVGCGLWEVSAEGSLKNVYKKNDALDCHFATPVHHAGYLYGFHGRQESGQQIRCLRLSDGHVMWRSDDLPAGSLLIADSKLLILTEQGELLIAPASPEQFKISFRTQVLGFEARALPAYSDGWLYARDKRQLVCVRVARD